MPSLEQRRAASAWIRERAVATLRPMPCAMAVFGSYARGDSTESSDLDLLLVGDEFPNRPSERSAWFFPLVGEWHRIHARFDAPFTLAPLYLTTRAWNEAVALRLSLQDHAWILWDDGWVSQGLLDARASLARGEWSRKPLPDGGWLWIRAKDAA